MIKGIWPYMEAAITSNRYAEPFAGGGSTFLHVAGQRPELKISINDKDPDVANFWSVVSGCNVDFKRLCAAVIQSRGPTDDPLQRLHYWHQIRGSKPDDPALAAFRFLFLNKTCFGGQINASPMGGYQQDGWQGRDGRGLACQYNVDTILANLHEARRLLAGRTTVTNLDVFDFLEIVRRASLYLDPPYFPHEVNRLYREGMSPAEHQRLADMLREFPHPWVLSYDNSSAVRELYSWANMVEIPMRSSHRPGRQNWKSKIELLILPAMLDVRLGECIQPHQQRNIPNAPTAIGSSQVTQAMNASQNTNMNGKEKESKAGDRPSKGSQKSNRNGDWAKVCLSKKGLHPTQVGKIESCLKVLQEGQKSSREFKEALDHLWEVEPDKESFCKHLGFSVAEAESILNPANKPASEAAPVDTHQHTSETAPGLEGQPDVEKEKDSQSPNDAARTNAPKPRPEVVTAPPVPASQRRAPNKAKKPSTPSDKKARPPATGEKKEKCHADAAKTNPAAGSSGETQGIPVYEDHPYAAIFPLDDGDPLDQLTDDIRLHGLGEPIVLFEGKILDGRRRYRACVRSGTPPTFVHFEGPNPAAFVLSKNIHRRNLEKGQRAAIAAELLLVIEKETRERKSATGGSTRDEQGRFSEKGEVEKIPPTAESDETAPETAATQRQKSRDIAGAALDVNPHYVSDAKAVMEDAPDLHELLKQGEITMSRAKRELAKRKPKSQSEPKKESKVNAQPFTVVLWDESGEDTPMPEILRDKKKRKTLTSAVVFHLTSQPKFALGSESKDGFHDAALFVLVDAPEPKNEHAGLILQKQSCLFLVARTCGEVPKPEIVPGQVIEGGLVEARKMIEAMWPTAPRLISTGTETPPEGWQVS